MELMSEDRRNAWYASQSACFYWNLGILSSSSGSSSCVFWFNSIIMGRWSLPRQSSSVYHVQFTARSGVTRERSIAVALCVETSGILVILPSFSRHKLEDPQYFQQVDYKSLMYIRFPKKVHGHWNLPQSHNSWMKLQCLLASLCCHLLIHLETFYTEMILRVVSSLIFVVVVINFCCCSLISVVVH